MTRTSTALMLLLLVCDASLGAQQPFPVTDKLSSLAGTWVRDATRGTGGICGVNPAEVITIAISPAAVTFKGGGARGDTETIGTVKLDGTQTTLADGRTATAALDAGWLAVTMRHVRNGGYTNVLREVYIVLRGDLTVWRTLNVELPDGSQGKIDCGNRQAIVYVRK